MDDGNHQINLSPGHESQATSDKRFSFSKNLTRSVSQPENSANEDNQKLSQSPNVVNPQQQGSTLEFKPHQVHIIEQKPKPYWETGEDSFEDGTEGI